MSDSETVPINTITYDGPPLVKTREVEYIKISIPKHLKEKVGDLIINMR